MDKVKAKEIIGEIESKVAELRAEIDKAGDATEGTDSEKVTNISAEIESKLKELAEEVAKEGTPAA